MYEEPLVVSRLSKVFKKAGRPFAAVNNLSFGVVPTECFGLLGLNGAGKTTTIGILTGELESSSGFAFLNGYNVSTEKLESKRSLGFCPQFVRLYNWVYRIILIFFKYKKIKGLFAGFFNRKSNT